MSRQIVGFTAAVMCVGLTMLAGCSLIGEGRERGCDGQEKTALLQGADELARRVPGVVLTGYVGCDSGDSAYVEWTHPSFAKLKQEVLALDCTHVPEATSDQTGGLDCLWAGQLFGVRYSEMSDKTVRGSVDLGFE
ncbi:hypothetical protein [Micropruina sp.]|uniref:hypothetical protein n=1 Tax=Micropruina sp. TaxID=2737536 RepID=UPI0039E34FB0